MMKAGQVYVCLHSLLGRRVRGLFQSVLFTVNVTVNMHSLVFSTSFFVCEQQVRCVHVCMYAALLAAQGMG
jgi:hypothetical protein